MLLNRTGGGGEHVTPQLDAQESIIEQIKEILPFKASVKKGIDFGYYENTSQSTSITIEHSLGVVPKYSFLISLKHTSTSRTLLSSNVFSVSGSGVVHSTNYVTATDKQVTFKSVSDNTYPFNATYTYLWVVIA